ncbi:MAG: XdhC family protein [Chloroflexales bacterium]|nr:XdhC family protein [Chloroflexales bacterium]
MSELYQILREAIAAGRPVATATLIAGPGPVGGKLLVWPDGAAEGPSGRQVAPPGLVLLAVLTLGLAVEQAALGHRVHRLVGVLTLGSVVAALVGDLGEVESNTDHRYRELKLPADVRLSDDREIIRNLDTELYDCAARHIK